MPHPLSDIRTLLNQLESICENMAQQNNVAHLSGPQGHVLFFLSKHAHRELFVKDIEKELQISKSVASNLVKRMEKNGFIQTVASNKDRRCKQLVLTELGREKIAPLKAFHEEMMRTVFHGISRQDMETVQKLIHQLQENIEKYKGEHHA